MHKRLKLNRDRFIELDRQVIFFFGLGIE